MGKDVFEVLPSDLHLLDVHLVLTYRRGGDGFEGASTDMKGDELSADALLLEALKHLVGEMEPGSRSGYGAFVLSIDCLVAFVVVALGLAIEVWGKGDDTGLIDDFREGAASGPLEGDEPSVANSLSSVCGEGDSLSVDGELSGHGTFFPFLIVAYETHPFALFTLGEGVDNGLLVWFEAEYLDGRSCGFLEEEACVDDFCVVENQERIRWKVLGYVREASFVQIAFAPYKKFRLIALF